MHVRYAFTRSSLGLVLVAATERGLCKVDVGGTKEALRRALADAFPRATLEEARPELTPLVSEVLRRIDGTGAESRVSFDVQATTFQRRVWDALGRIPRGETRTYSEIARSIGAPNAARAVGAACAKNQLAVVIPCHRAVRGDGTLAGFAWGLDRKRRLLDLEQRAASA